MKKSDLSEVIVIIPVYNDKDNLLKVLTGFTDSSIGRICLVIDCATQEDLNEIEERASLMGPSVHIIRNQKRKGVGNAIRQGIEHAIENGCSTAVIMAGNGKDDPREIPRFLSPILNDGYDYVQGSRFLPGGKRVKNPFLREVFSRLYPYLWTLLTNTRCTDVTNGFRAYRLKIFSDKRINIWQKWLDGYELEYYIHYKVLTLGYKMKEVPVSKIYPYNYKGGYSKISPFRDWWKIVGPLVYLKLGAKD